jgi:eukaryotic-like serine/threonine-protein kinase
VTQLSVIARAAGASESSLSASTSLSEDARAFLQRRVSAVGRVLALIFGTFLAIRVVVGLTVADALGPAESAWNALPLLVTSVLAFLVLWLACRRGRRSLRAIRSIEGACLLVGCTATMLLPTQVPYAARPDYIVLLALGLIIIARAVYVPGSARDTLAIGIVLGVPLLVILHGVHRTGHDPAHFTALAHPLVLESSYLWAVRWTVIDGVWWLALVAVATATSHVIYGLRREVSDARKLGQYTLGEKIGEGGMGAVYRASHAMLRRPAAVKLLPPERLGAQATARFEREVQLTAVLTHPNTVRVFDYGRTPDGVLYYVMELLEGATLAEVVAATGPMPAGRVVHVLDHLVGALAEAHGIGLIHRDIKPANVILAEQGGVRDVVKVVDFGLVKEVARQPEPGVSTAPELTQANTIAGTPYYMAPEAIKAPATVDARSDLYAVGAVGYYLITGRDVFSGGNSFEVFAHHLHTPPVPPSQRLGEPVSADLEELLLHCLAKDPAQRPADARTLLASLRRLRDAGTWSESHAAAWWGEHATAVRSRRARPATATDSTMAVDLDHRLDGILDRRADPAAPTAR